MLQTLERLVMTISTGDAHWTRFIRQRRSPGSNGALQTDGSKNRLGVDL